MPDNQPPKSKVSTDATGRFLVIETQGTARMNGKTIIDLDTIVAVAIDGENYTAEFTHIYGALVIHVWSAEAFGKILESWERWVLKT